MTSGTKLAVRLSAVLAVLARTRTDDILGAYESSGATDGDVIVGYEDPFSSISDPPEAGRAPA